MTVAGLRRFLEPPPAPVPRCELCAEAIGDPHGHVVNTESRALLCTCRGCWLLFTAEGAGGLRYRAVPDRYLRPDLALTEAHWDALQVPVGMAYFFRNSIMGRVVAFYPSPAGATESVLPPDTWDALVAGLEPDVEALLVRREPAGLTAYVVPIDACYELVGLVRTHWKGFDGGQEAHAAIADFFARVDERAPEVVP